jgi:hypothetical protein
MVGAIVFGAVVGVGLSTLQKNGSEAEPQVLASALTITVYKTPT